MSQTWYKASWGIQVSLLLGNVSQVRDMAHQPLVHIVTFEITEVCLK